ncbi:hypothetical protein E8Q33_03500 [Methylophaga sp. SB9B]|uniref:hypothetical protein n=1 Tax=Methylophaga sp. SB9B TaxID=2570356 RepID=UPI0010A7C481|nr:hypothetical protein [Methylophaga sp. SB9B]THK42605.1 hypothetical protein E8Q33_03500 [Methylophaga sp. SB9B]
MHILAGRTRSEFLAVPQMFRLANAEGERGLEPTILVKANSVLLKYILQGVPIKLIFARIDDRIVYVLTVYDEPTNPTSLWSVFEYDEELEALCQMVQIQRAPVFLFNELAINVAWAYCSTDFNDDVTELLRDVTVGGVDYELWVEKVDDLLGEIHLNERIQVPLIVSDINISSKWTPVSNSLITSHAEVSPIDIFSSDEGRQQEHLAVWLTDSIDPLNVHASPQIPKGKGTRELTDVILSHKYGATLIESKSLTVIGRDKLPSRNKLAADLSSHIEKAVKQLRGGIRHLKRGTPVTTKSRAVIDVEREQPFHAIVLIPDFGLVQDRDSLGVLMMRDFAAATGGFLHIVDVSELLRIVQASEMISERGTTITPLMAFDSYLTERFQQAMEAGTLCIEVLIRFSDGAVEDYQ